MTPPAPIVPWADPTWLERVGISIDEHLDAAGRPRTGPLERVKVWGRAVIHRAPAAAGDVWIKHAYRLPPGEEVVLEALARRWPAHVPHVIATWPGAVAMDALPGRELLPSDPVESWTAAAGTIAALAAGEIVHAAEWLDAGVRDRRPPVWSAAVLALQASPVLAGLDADIRTAFDAFVPSFVTRYVDSFAAPATLVPQDSGCCNIHVAADGVVLFDWADVVIGHPTFSCDRLLDQASAAYHEPIIDAFCRPLRLPRAEFSAMRRSNVLNEVLRYHDELAYLAPDDPVHASLAASVCSQITVLVRHESARRPG